MSVAVDFQKDFIKHHRRQLWSKFIRAIKRYHLIEDGDRVAVAVSGGKDSMLLARMLQELTKHPLADFEVVPVAMDPGYAKADQQQLKHLAHQLSVPLKIVKKELFRVVNEKAPDDPCYLCARMRRGILYEIAENEGCNKLALGHHYDDVIETTLLNVFFSGSFKTMLPRIPSDNYESIELIRPLYFIREAHIAALYERHNLDAMDCACTVASGERPSKREDIKQLIKQLREEHKDIDRSIFNAAQNVNLDYVLGYTKAGRRYRPFED